MARSQKFAVAFLAGIVFPSLAFAGGTVDVRYDVEVAGTRIMKASFSATIDAGQYSSSLDGKTTGVSNLFSKYKTNMTAEGLVRDNAFIPGTFGNDRKKNSKKSRSTDLTWSGNGKVLVETGDGTEEPEGPVAKALGRNAADPLTTILRLANTQADKPCSGSFRVFDGRDVYDLALSFRKQVVLASASTEGNSGFDCKLTYTPIAGRAFDKGETEIETYGVVLAPLTMRGLRHHIYLPIQITGKSSGLSAVVSATSVTVDGQELNIALGN